MNTPTLDQLKHGLQIAEQIAALQAELSAIFNGGASPASAPAPTDQQPRKKHRMSPQALANIRAAQKKRWAKVNAANAAPKAAAPAPAQRKKRKISPAHKAKLAAAAKKRWTAIKAGKAPNPFAGRG
jgi:hypothetical protein